MQTYNLEEYIRQRNLAVNEELREDGVLDFKALCEQIKEAFFRDWENRENSGLTLEIQKRAIIGYEKEKNFF